jgi:TolA-binding protein
MRKYPAGFLLCACFFLPPGGLPSAVAESQNVPVRRAEPVNTPPPQDWQMPTDPNQVENPAWMERVRPALPPTSPEPMATPVPRPDSMVTPEPIQRPTEPTPRGTPYRPPTAQPRDFEPIPPAQPLQEPPPATPAPIVRPALPPETPTPSAPLATPVPTPTPTPASTPTTSAVAIPTAPAVETAPPDRTAPADSPSSIRIAPTADADLNRPRQIQTPKDYADALYARKMYDLAVPEYEMFLRDAPPGPDRTAAWFRLAESQRHLNRPAEARRAYEALLQETRRGEFAGAAAYRLASILMDEKLFSGAAANFEIAAKEAQDPAVRLSATFFAARCYEQLGDNRKAFLNFEEVRKVAGADSRYEEYSLSAMARLAAEMGRNAAAIKLYQELAASTTNPQLRTEAELKTAQLLIDEDRAEEARALLVALGERGDAPGATAIARFGLLELDFAAKNYDKVAATPLEDLAVLDESSRPRGLLLVAHAHRLTNQFGPALALYDRILNEYPNSPAAREAKFHRLVCLFRQDDPGLLDALNRFLLEARDSTEIDQARLLKAETHFHAQQWKEAADAYGALARSRLPDNLLADAVFKHAWCLSQIGSARESVVAYSDFIDRFPNNELVHQALVARGMAHLQNGAHDAANRDFDRVLQSDVTPPEREMALLQRALSYGSRQDYQRMRADFEQLVQEFPDSAARAQAEFWIGYAKFEGQDYEGSLPHLKEARSRDAETYESRATLRIMLANYYLERPEETAREIEEHELANVPSEVYQWLASKFLEAGNPQRAEHFLNTLLAGKAGDAPSPEIFLQLSQSRIQQRKFDEAKEPANRYLELVREPGPRARGLMAQAEAWLGAGEYAEAARLAEDAQVLQPEGRVNAEARLLAGRIHAARGDHAEAAKAFMTVAVLYDDESLSPEALRRAVAAYQRSNNSMEADKALEELRRRYPAAEASPLEG